MPSPAPPLVADSNGFTQGCKTAATSVFAFVITVTYIGFGALCHDYSLPVCWAMASTILQWAGPAQVILVTSLGNGTAMFETALAVSLSSVRLLPMVVALLPLVKRDDTRPWQLLLPVHYWAVSVWVEAMRLAPGVPREQRIPFCNGIGFVLLCLAGVMTVVGYYLQSVLPAVFGAAAMFITPMSFLTSTARNAKLLLEKAALVIGLIIAPVLAFYEVQFDMLWTGLIGGTLAYGIDRAVRMRRASS